MADGDRIQSNWRIGFACHYLEWPVKGNEPVQSDLTRFRSTTVKHVDAIGARAAGQLLDEIVLGNLSALARLIRKVADYPLHRRMLRLSCDLFPLYTHAHPSVRRFYDSEGWADVSLRVLGEIGRTARQHGIRLSFHPGQYTVLNSRNPAVQDAAVSEIDAFADIAAMMGFVGWHKHGWCINIHGGSRDGGVEGFAHGWQRLSAQSRCLLTVENDEFTWGLFDLERLHAACRAATGFGPPIVVDLHHHWIKTGRYLNPANTRLSVIRETWRNPFNLGEVTRPKMHLSMSPMPVAVSSLFGDDRARVEMHMKARGYDQGWDLVPMDYPDFPRVARLVNSSGKRHPMLRQHSNGIWHIGVLDWALCFWTKFDLVLEAKAKNLAVDHVAARAEEIYGSGERA